jgi:Mrp family chromosome partitioning ATPase
VLAGCLPKDLEAFERSASTERAARHTLPEEGAMTTEDDGAADRFDLRRALAIARRRWRLTTACALAVAGAAFAFSVTQQKQYTASASLLLRDQGLTQALLPTAVTTMTVDPTREAETNIDLVSSPAVIGRVATAVHMTPAAVAADVKASAQGATNLVSVYATSADPRLAAILANTFAAQAIAVRRETDQAQVIQAQSVVQAQLNAMTAAELNGSDGQLLQSRNEELKLLAAGETGNTQLIHSASAPSTPSLPRTKRSVELGLLLGLLLGVGAAALAERLNRRVREPEEFREIFGLPVLTEIPEIRALKRKRSQVRLGPNERNAFRMLLARVRYTNPKPDSQIRSVLVTSAGTQEGKSMVAWHLAETAALAGDRRVLLVEADMRVPVIAARHGLRAAPGLRELLVERLELNSAIQTVPLSAGDDRVTQSAKAGTIRFKVRRGHTGKTSEDTAISGDNADTAVRHAWNELPHRSSAREPNVDVIVAGMPARDPSPLIESEMMVQLLGTLQGYYDLIVFDTVPALLVPDAMPLLTMVEGVLVVGRLGFTTRDQASMLRDELHRLNVHALGVIVNEVNAGSRRSYGHYPTAMSESATIRPFQPSALGLLPDADYVRHRHPFKSDGSAIPGRLT